MYEERFGFTGRPFQLTPDPAFWYETATHRKAMAYLGYGLAQGEGFIVVTGDIGAGKTTLMGHLTDTLDPQALNAIRLVSTAIDADDLLRIVAGALGVDPAGLAKAQLLTAVERGLHAVARQGRRTLLLVDEAQALPVSALEELRMLSNFQLGGHALVQIVLMGQPEFRDRLAGTDRLEQLRQRVIAIHHLDPMEPDEVAAYIGHRLAVVGWNGTPDFAEDAFAALHHHTDGIPRRLNQLTGRVLLQAGIDGTTLIDAAMVSEVAADLRADLPVAAIARPKKPVVEIAEVVEPIAAPPPAWLTDPEPTVEATTEPASQDRSVASPPVSAGEPAMIAVADDTRIAALEERVEAQDAALRRVLTLLVDWVESDVPRAGLSPLRDAAA